ncbi:MAG: hypothetical protein KC643_32300 [Nitrospira sp.]|nr:hypothetical protein [Nitrospira sp.]
MKKAKIKGYKKVRTSLFLGRGIRALFRVGLQMLITCLPLLPFIAIGAVFFLPQSPHLRVSYTYTGSYEYPSYRTCQYLGVHGTVQVIGQDCPLVAFIEGKF